MNNYLLYSHKVIHKYVFFYLDSLKNIYFFLYLIYFKPYLQSIFHLFLILLSFMFEDLSGANKMFGMFIIQLINIGKLFKLKSL